MLGVTEGAEGMLQVDEVCYQFHWDLLAVCVVATLFGVALLQLSNRRLGMFMIPLGMENTAALEPWAGGHCIGGETLLSCTI